MARILGGALRGMALEMPRQIRATEAKVRQAVMNILAPWLPGARMLDGFAGSGAIGLEALSRGASEVVLLESHPASLKALRANLARIPPDTVEGATELIAGDALRGLARLADEGCVFDLIFLDPPYDAEMGKKALITVAGCGILSASGRLCLEHARQHQPPLRVGDLVAHKQHRYGDTVLSFYERA